MEENLKKHIFDKFNSNNKKMGTGLGLYFCRLVINAHGGTIDLKTDNSNIEFFISIPKKNSDEKIIQFK